MHVHGLGQEFEYSVTLDGIAFYIYDSGHSVHLSEPYTGALHNHYIYEIQYMHDGEVEVYTDETSFPIGKKELFFIGKGVYHYMSTKKMLRTAFNVEIGLPKGNDANVKDYKSILKCLSKIGPYRVFRDAYISSLMSALEEISNDSFAYPYMNRGLLMLGVFLRIIDIAAEENDIHLHGLGKLKYSRDFERKRVIEYHLEQCYAMSHGLKDLSARLYLSEKQTGMLVKKLMGESYKKLITRQRMKVANRLMQSERSLLEIARYVGYSSYNGFFVAYSKTFGIAPEEARMRIAKGDLSFEKKQNGG